MLLDILQTEGSRVYWWGYDFYENEKAILLSFIFILF